MPRLARKGTVSRQLKAKCKRRERKTAGDGEKPAVSSFTPHANGLCFPIKRHRTVRSGGTVHKWVVRRNSFKRMVTDSWK